MPKIETNKTDIELQLVRDNQMRSRILVWADVFAEDEWVITSASLITVKHGANEYQYIDEGGDGAENLAHEMMGNMNWEVTKLTQRGLDYINLYGLRGYFDEDLEVTE